MAKQNEKSSKLKNSIIGFIEGEKIGKNIWILNQSIDVGEASHGKIFKIKKTFKNLFQKKENFCFKVYEKKVCIEDRLRSTIAESLNGSFAYAVSKGQVKQEHKLAYLTVKAINIITANTITTLSVRSEYNGKQEPIVFTDNIEIYKETRYTAIEMKMAFKKYLPEVYANLKTIQEFPNSEMNKLLLTAEEEEMMTMLKRKWIIIPSKNVSVLNEIQEKISAYKEIEM